MKIEGADIARLLNLLAIGRGELDDWEADTDYEVASDIADTLHALVSMLTGIMHDPKSWV